MNAFEIIGRKEAALQDLLAEYGRLLEVLALAKSGELPLDRIEVDVAGQRWRVAPQVNVVIEEPDAPAPDDGGTAVTVGDPAMNGACKVHEKS